MSKLIERLRSVAANHRSDPAVVWDESMTFSQLWAQTVAFARGLRERDIAGGEAVGIRVSNPRAFLVAFYGTLRNGCVPVTMPTEYDDRDARTALDQTNARGFVTDQRRLPSILTRVDSLRLGITVDCDMTIGVDFDSLLDTGGLNDGGTGSEADFVRRATDDPGLIAYVGRHERELLAVEYSLSSLASAAAAGSMIAVAGSGRNAEVGIGGHIGAVSLSNPLELLYGATATMLDGSRYRPLETWDPETALSIRRRTDLARLFVTPRQYLELRDLELEDAEGIGVVEAVSDAERVSSAIWRVEAKNGTSVVRLYGSPETGLTHVRSPADVKAGRLGDPLPGIDASVRRARRRSGRNGDRESGRIVTGKGELAISGPTTMDGYFGRPELTAETVESGGGKRWIRTGAPARIEDDVIHVNGPPSLPSTRRSS